jgi:hypothetical protein
MMTGVSTLRRSAPDEFAAALARRPGARLDAADAAFLEHQRTTGAEQPRGQQTEIGFMTNQRHGRHARRRRDGSHRPGRRHVGRQLG